MKKIISLIVCMLYYATTFSQVLENMKEDNPILVETTRFIDKINNEYINNSRFAVFVIYGIESDSSKKLCLTISYIMNSYEYEFIESQHYFKYKDNFVIISSSRVFDISLLHDFSPKTITSTDKEKIINTLFPKKRGGITYTAQALLYCIDNNKLSKSFFENSDNLPLDKSIYRKNLEP